MAPLLDRLNEKFNKPTKEAVPGPDASLQPQLAKLQQAKSGKASQLATSAPQASGMATSAAQQQFNVQAKGVDLGNKIASQQLAETGKSIEDGEQQQLQSLGGDLAREKQINSDQIQGVLRSYRQENEKLNTNQGIADMEQAGFMIRLGNKEYVDGLNRAAEQAGLDNQAEFDLQIQRNVFDNDLEMFNDEQTFQKLMGASDRQFKEELAQMDINTAIDMFSKDQQAQKTSQIYEGSTGIFNSSINYLKDKKQAEQKRQDLSQLQAIRKGE